MTLADFWGINAVAPQMNDGMGTSLLLVNSLKGMNAFTILKDKLEYIPTDYEKSLMSNPSRFKSCEVNKQRDKYFKEVNEDNFETLTKKLTRVTILKKMEILCERGIHKIKRIIRCYKD